MNCAICGGPVDRDLVVESGEVGYHVMCWEKRHRACDGCGAGETPARRLTHGPGPAAHCAPCQVGRTARPAPRHGLSLAARLERLERRVSELEAAAAPTP